MDTIIKQILQSMMPMAIDMLLQNIDGIRAFLLIEAQKTDNGLDDMLVSVVTDWLEGLLIRMQDEAD